MTRFQRRAFMVFFILLFVFTAPVVIFFATGYRFDQDNNIFVHSGSITVKSWPKDINIYIDNKLQPQKKLNTVNSSFTVNGIKPGKHVLRCEKDGYTSWEKNVEVHSGVSTEFWNVLLFPTNKQENKTYNSLQVQQFFLSPRNNNEIVFFSKDQDGNKVSLLNIKDNSIDEIYRTTEFNFLDPSLEENVEWSSDNKQILIPFSDNSGNKTYIIARANKDSLKNIVNLNNLFGNSEEQFEKVRWMFDKNDELVVLTKNHNLYYFYLNNPQDTLLIDDNISAFDFAGNRIYYTQLPNNLIWEIKNNDIETKRQITNFSVSTSEKAFLKLTVYDEYRICLLTGDGELYVYNEEKEKGEKAMNDLGTNIQDVQFSNDGKKLLYWNSNEIWVLFIRDWDVQPIRKKNDKIIVTRFSQKINNVQWMDNYENIIFSVDNTIKSAEIDVRDHANIVDLTKTDYEIDNRDIFYNKNNQLLINRKKIGSGFVLESSLIIDKSSFFGF